MLLSFAGEKHRTSSGGPWIKLIPNFKSIQRPADGKQEEGSMFPGELHVSMAMHQTQ